MYVLKAFIDRSFEFTLNFGHPLFVAEPSGLSYFVCLTMILQEVICHYLNLLYIILIFSGLLFAVPFIRRVVVNDMSLLTLVITT